jgi:hypothetical protein
MSSEKQQFCEICQAVTHKYVCPRCKLHTCSLPCFKKHKIEKNCSGLSDVSSGTRDSYINKKELANDDVQRDYNFLLKMNRSLELSKRKKSELKIMKPSHNYNNHNKNRNNHNNVNQKWVLQRGVRVMKVPFGMERGKMNKSGGKSNNWMWTIEWLFIDSNKKILKKYIKYKSSENAILNTIIPKDWISEGQDYNILFEDNEKKKFVKIPSSLKLSEALHSKLIIEFPTLYITTDELKAFTDVENDEKETLSSLGSSNSDSDSDSDSSDSTSDSPSDSNSDSDSDSGSEPEEESSKDPNAVEN